ncbi:hypothetical protein GW796_07915 [archaeon]|nr:hypothetical protein [archaeon]
MGSARWSADDWTTYSSTSSTKSTADLFRNSKMVDALNPALVELRESRDSVLNPQSTAIIVGLDVTGSMGMIADALAKEGLGIMVEEILKRKPVSDPHMLIAGIGDAYCDSAPLQITQFEADITIAKQLEQIWLEKGGGANDFESYNLPWYFAAKHTSIDCMEKRGKKGYLFTVGDEQAPKGLTKAQLKKIFNDDVEKDYTTEELFLMASKMYNIFHIVVEEGSYARSNLSGVMKSWTELLGQRVIRLSDYKKLAEVVVSTIEVTEGKDVDSVTKSWDGSTSVVVSRAINSLATKRTSGGVVKF